MIGSLLDFGTSLMDKLFPDKDEANKAKVKLLEMEQNGELKELDAKLQIALGQLAVNKQEAAHKSIFVAGWRPGLGWVCVTAFAWQFVLFPICTFFVTLRFPDAPDLPTVGTDQLFELVLGMLGLGALRTYEKGKGIARNK